MKHKFQYFSVGLIGGWLGIFGLASFLIMVVISVLQHDPDRIAVWHFTLQNYADLFNPIFLKIFIKSFYIAFVVTAVCLVLGYPFAYIVSHLPEKLQNMALLLLLLPFWTSSVVRRCTRFFLTGTPCAGTSDSSCSGRRRWERSPACHENGHPTTT